VAGFPQAVAATTHVQASSAKAMLRRALMCVKVARSRNGSVTSP
jgi:hypothetical protein